MTGTRPSHAHPPQATAIAPPDVVQGLKANEL